MSCFSCFSSSSERRASRRFDAASRKSGSDVTSRKSDVTEGTQRNRSSFRSNKMPASSASTTPRTSTSATPSVKENPMISKAESRKENIAAQTFTFRELASATKNFMPECLIGEGGFGRVYKGCLESTSQLVAVKKLDRSGLQGNTEFLVEVLMLSLLHHENLVNLIGYCADGDQRLLVYEYMPLGSLEDHLLEISPNKEPLSWPVRMKIAFGAAQGLEYLHEKANPPVIYRDLKSSNILLDQEFNPKLSDFGLAKIGSVGDKVHVSSRVMGTYGYCAPEYARTGQLTMKSDVYSFGVLLLELITGRRVIDTMRPTHEENLVTWAEQMFKDQKRYSELADPLLRGDYPATSLNQTVAVAAMCLQDEASTRPLMTDVVTALSCLMTPKDSIANERSILLDQEIAQDRDRAVAEAIEWGSNPGNNQR